MLVITSAISLINSCLRDHYRMIRLDSNLFKPSNLSAEAVICLQPALLVVSPRFQYFVFRDFSSTIMNLFR